MLRWLRQNICLLAVLAVLTLPAAAREIGPDGRPLGLLGRDVEARFLYPAGKNFDYNCLFPVVLEYQNLSSSPQYMVLKWPLDMEVSPSYKTVQLEPGAKKRLHFLLPPRSASNLFNVEVNAQNVNVGLQNNSQNPVTGLLAPKNDALDFLRGLQVEKNRYYNPSQSSDAEEYHTLQAVSTVNHEVFPTHWGALEALDVLICYDLNALNLGTEQLNAIKNWVIQGGELVIISNGIPNEYKGSPLEDILPLAPKGSHKASKTIMVVGAPTPDAQVVSSHEGQPLLLKRPEQSGQVFYLAAPLLDTNILGKDETTSLWRSIFGSVVSKGQTGGPFTYNVLDSMPELPRTEAVWVALFVILYGIIVGPVNLTILRKKDKMLLAFVTVPAVAILFAGGAYAINRILRPSTPVLREIGWLQLPAGSTTGVAAAEQILFSPSGRWFTFTSDSTTLFDTSRNHYRNRHQFGLFEVTPELGLRSSLEMGTWDIQRFNSRSVLSLDSPFQGQWKEESKTVTITSPLNSQGKTAVVCHPKLAVSEPFELKKGTNDYQVSFLQSSSPATSIVFDDKENPGRRDLINQVWNNNSMDPNHIKLFFFTEELKTPLTLEESAKYRHDYLVTVAFKR